jgi:hypothetical protein
LAEGQEAPARRIQVRTGVRSAQVETIDHPTAAGQDLIELRGTPPKSSHPPPTWIKSPGPEDRSSSENR